MTDEERKLEMRPIDIASDIYPRQLFRNNIKGEAGALADIARGLIAAVHSSAIELPVTIKLEDAEIYVAATYMRLELKELKEVTSNEPPE